MIYVFDFGYPDQEDSKFSKTGGIGIFDDHIQHTETPSSIRRLYLLYVRSEAEINYY